MRKDTPKDISLQDETYDLITVLDSYPSNIALFKIKNTGGWRISGFQYPEPYLFNTQKIDLVFEKDLIPEPYIRYAIIRDLPKIKNSYPKLIPGWVLDRYGIKRA